MKGALPDNRTVKRFLALLRDVPPGVTSLQLGDFRVEFAQGRPEPTVETGYVPPVTVAPRPDAVPLVPGTPFPDDDSRIDAADLYLADIELDMTAPELS